MVYLGSHMGDSQLLRIEPIPTGALNSRTLPIPVDIHVFPALQVFSQARKEDDWTDNPRRIGRIVDNHGNYVTVSQTFKNIGPIVDAILVDPDGTGEVSHLSQAEEKPAFAGCLSSLAL
jgi:DNA damage-binding protein 1